MKSSTSQKQVIRSRQVHTRSASLNIPELPEDASDDDIVAALANLEAAKEMLFVKRKALAEHVQEVLLSWGTVIPEEEANEMVSQIRDDLKTSAESITDLSGIGDI
jgi:hypothetical protein